MSLPRPLWSERNSRGPAVAVLSTSDAAEVLVSIVDDLWESDRLQEAFGYDCIDEFETVPGQLGPNPGRTLLLETGRANLWPMSEHAGSWDQDTLLDAVEIIGRLVSSGVEEEGAYHSYSNCGWHFGRFEREPAFSEYRSTVNRLLRRYDGGFRLNESGEVERLLDSSLDSLAHPAAGHPPLSTSDEELIQAAIAKYRLRDLSARRDAVRNLADVHERLRATAPRLPRRDEDALFTIYNEFWIRHNTPDSRSEYDHDIWWDWLFHVALASIRLIQAMSQQAASVEAAAGALIADLERSTFYRGTLAQRLSELSLGDLPEDLQQKVGFAVGRRCVGGTGVVQQDGLLACAASADLEIWPIAYRVGLVNGLLVNTAGQLDTIPEVQPAAVLLLQPLDDHAAAATSFVSEACGRPLSLRLSRADARAAASTALQDAASHLPPGSEHDAWIELAERLGGGGSG